MFCDLRAQVLGHVCVVASWPPSHCSGFKDRQSAHLQQACPHSRPGGQGQVGRPTTVSTYSLSTLWRNVALNVELPGWEALVQEGHQMDSWEQSARCTGAGEAAPLAREHARLPHMHIERYSMPLLLMSLPQGLSATRGQWWWQQNFSQGHTCPTMYTLPRHNRALYPGTNAPDGTVCLRCTNGESRDFWFFHQGGLPWTSLGQHVSDLTTEPAEPPATERPKQATPLTSGKREEWSKLASKYGRCAECGWDPRGQPMATTTASRSGRVCGHASPPSKRWTRRDKIPTVVFSLEASDGASVSGNTGL
jgi:hypothetical protein